MRCIRLPGGGVSYLCLMVVALIGAGGVGSAMACRLAERGHKVYLVHRPTQTPKGPFTGLTDWRELPISEVETVLLCVRDKQIAPLAQELKAHVPDGRWAIGHTAGSVEMEVLAVFFRRGVVYPLQTFSRGMPVAWGSFPVFWEGDPVFKYIAEELAGAKERVYPACSATRLRLHIGAVFAANFTNALMGIARKIVQPEWDHRVYLPLLEAVVAKLHELSPEEAQTGPAHRGDEQTLQKHLACLRQQWPHIALLYEALSRYIQSQSLQ